MPAATRTVLLIGRGARLSRRFRSSLGERTGVVGALSIEAAAKHLNVARHRRHRARRRF